MKDNKVVEAKEKVTKLEEKLAGLLEQKKSLEAKITNVKNEIEKYNNIINQQTFNELNEVLNVKGISIDELMGAIKSGNLGSLGANVSNNASNIEVKNNEVSNINNMSNI